MTISAKMTSIDGRSPLPMNKASSGIQRSSALQTVGIFIIRLSIDDMFELFPLVEDIRQGVRGSGVG
jgi:hypothetical protein